MKRSPSPPCAGSCKTPCKQGEETTATDHAAIWKPLLEQYLLLQEDRNDATMKQLLQACIESTKHIVFNPTNPSCNPNHVNTFVVFQHEINSLDYRPLMYVINQYESTHH